MMSNLQLGKRNSEEKKYSLGEKLDESIGEEDEVELVKEGDG